jgi:hypothetical protein
MPRHPPCWHGCGAAVSRKRDRLALRRDTNALAVAVLRCTLDVPAEPLDHANIYREGMIRAIEVLAEPVSDIDEVFAKARERIEQGRSLRPIPKSTVRAMAASARKSDQ